jgi:hypothetical protein
MSFFNNQRQLDQQIYEITAIQNVSLIRIEIVLEFLIVFFPKLKYHIIITLIKLLACPYEIETKKRKLNN